MMRSLLVLFSAIFVAQPAYSQTTLMPDAKAHQDFKDLLERVKPDPQTLDLAKQHYLLQYDDMRRRIGFMKYCGDKQLIDMETAKKAHNIYKRMEDFLFYDESASHRSYDRPSGDEAERQGSIGVFYYKDWGNDLATLGQEGRKFNPNGKSLDEYAKTRELTPAALCEQWAKDSSAFEPTLTRLDEVAKIVERLRSPDPVEKR
jgi:hypothetical protein